MRLHAVLLLMLWCVANAHAQTPSLDARTQQLLTDHRWHDAVKLCDSAFAANVDYFNLRYRCGFAQYKMKRYRHAAEQCRRARRFNGYDSLNNALLYRSCLRGARYEDAFWVGRDLPYASAARPFDFLYAEAGMISYRTSESLGTLRYYQLGMQHRLDHAFRFYHGLQYTEQPIAGKRAWQLTYYVRAEARPALGFSVSPVFGVTHESTQSLQPDYLIGLLFNVSRGLLDVHGGAYFFNTDTLQYAQLPLALEFFPLANDKVSLWGEADQTFANGSASSFYKIGLRTHPLKPLWVSMDCAYVHSGTLIESDGYVITDSQDELLERYQLQAIGALSGWVHAFVTLQRGSWIDGYLRRSYTTYHSFLGMKFYLPQTKHHRP